MSESEHTQHSAEDPATQICIYCKRPSGDAKGREHVLPEALGNPTWVLPRGAVCDRCNNRFGNKIDTPFVNQGIGALRALLAIPGKKGIPTWTLPKDAEYSGDGVADCVAKGQRMKTVTSRNPRRASSVDKSEPAGRFELTVRRAPAHSTSAFLSKLFIATVAVQVGVAEALKPLLDLHRENMKKARPGNFLPFREDDNPGATDLKPRWVVSLFPDGLMLNLWDEFQFAMQIDGGTFDPNSPPADRLDLPRGAVAQYGGPDCWPDEWLAKYRDKEAADR